MGDTCPWVVVKDFDSHVVKYIVQNFKQCIESM